MGDKAEIEVVEMTEAELDEVGGGVAMVNM